MTGLHDLADALRDPRRRIGLAILACPGLLLIIGLGYASLGLDAELLLSRNVDEYVIVRNIRGMYDYLHRKEWAHFLNIYFKLYGSVFVFTTFLVSVPFLLRDSIDALVYALRSMTSILAAASILMLSAWAWRTSKSITAGLFVGIVAIACPGLWVLAGWIRPDWLMAFFVIVATWYAARQENPVAARQLALCAFLYALALSSKFQAAIYAAGVVVAIGFNAFDGRPGPIRRLARNLAQFGALTLFFYIALNPFFWTKEGPHEYLEQLQLVLDSNATGHFSYEQIPISQKIQSLEGYYGPLWVYGVLVAIAAIGLVRTRERAARIAGTALFAMSMTSFTYLLFTLNKAGGYSYYYCLSYLALLPVSAVGFTACIANRRLASAALLLFSLSMLAGSATDTAKWIDNYRADLKRLTAESETLERTLRPLTGKNMLIVMSPYTPLRISKLGLTDLHLHIIWGPLKADYARVGDLLVLRMDDMYFGPDNPPPNPAAAAEYTAARRLVAEMRAGRNADFTPCGETDRAYIFCRRQARS